MGKVRGDSGTVLGASGFWEARRRSNVLGARRGSRLPRWTTVFPRTSGTLEARARPLLAEDTGSGRTTAVLSHGKEGRRRGRALDGHELHRSGGRWERNARTNACRLHRRARPASSLDDKTKRTPAAATGRRNPTACLFRTRCRGVFGCVELRPRPSSHPLAHSLPRRARPPARGLPLSPPPPPSRRPARPAPYSYGLRYGDGPQPLLDFVRFL